jgi:probable rRNA maturation factor
LIEVEVFGAPPQAPSFARTRRLCLVAAASAGVQDGHLAIEFVTAARIAELNSAHRNKDAATDVLSFPIDGACSDAGPRELGDVVICPEHTADLCEAIVHGVLHLVGMDHETDHGEMLALQAELLRWEIDYGCGVGDLDRSVGWEGLRDHEGPDVGDLDQDVELEGPQR